MPSVVENGFDDGESLVPCAGLKPIQSEFQGEFQTEILPISKQFKAIQTKNFNCPEPRHSTAKIAQF